MNAMADVMMVTCDQWRISKRHHSMSRQQKAELKELFDSVYTGGSGLTFVQFMELLKTAGLPAARLGFEEQWYLFKKVAAGIDSLSNDLNTVSFDAFCEWVAMAEDDDAAILEERTDASLYASLVRALTSMSRPLAQNLAVIGRLLAKKATMMISQRLTNPVGLFRKAAVGTLEIISKKRSSMTLAKAIQAEYLSGGLFAITRLAVGPYIINTIVALSMFNTYTKVKEVCTPDDPDDSWKRRFAADAKWKEVAKVELVAAVAAGTVQALLHTPVYNIKRSYPGVTLTEGCMRLYEKDGIRAVMADCPLVWVQECVGLTCFFGSYELLKTVLEPQVAEDQHVLAWVAAGMAAGTLLTAINHPFDNLHEWHVVHRNAKSHPNALIHFMSSPIARSRWRQVLFRGMARRLPLGLPAGLPLLFYECMVGHSKE